MCIRGNKQFQEEQYHQIKSHEIRSGNRLMWDHEKTNTILVEIFLSKLLQEIHSQSTLNDLLILSSAAYIQLPISVTSSVLEMSARPGATHLDVTCTPVRHIYL